MSLRGEETLHRGSSSKGSAKVADRSPFKIHRELKSILGDETIEVTKLGSGDLMVELKPSRIRADYLTLDVRPYIPLPMRRYKCERYGHGKDRCKKPAVVCDRYVARVVMSNVTVRLISTV
ncbi:Zinc-dependent peptidases, insulinase domain-containing protein [Plakobranchus ocellatus]|uniref:Zinc-dependent peptidases, insulinase domain-containing protein n=1 Tax=Plakobranchus ocellatus TaxID=259542 RepID=A0AAV3ZEF6_9GAST|nr:Zinc-dependent peptidases, insulinase domain-containing protein [Plakobranchus ocellatus]